MTRVTHIKPDAAMVYASLLIRLRERGLSKAMRRELDKRARRLRGTLTEYELNQANKLAGDYR